MGRTYGQGQIEKGAEHGEGLRQNETSHKAWTIGVLFIDSHTPNREQRLNDLTVMCDPFIFEARCAGTADGYRYRDQVVCPKPTRASRFRSDTGGGDNRAQLANGGGQDHHRSNK